jgi:hypothetical protein
MYTHSHTHTHTIYINKTEGAQVAGSADIYSLGIIIVELFSTFGSGMERVMVLSAARDGAMPAHLTRHLPHIASLAQKCTVQILKSQSFIVALHSKYSRALTFENVSGERGGAAAHSAGST